MPALISEGTQYVGTDGKPIVNGKLYIGTKGLNPRTNLKTIYSDRALTVAAANPQTLDAYGRTTDKIWLDGEFSQVVDDENDVQKYQDLDAGANAGGEINILSAVAGTNAITGTGNPTVSALSGDEIFMFRAAGNNTGAVTLQVDSTPAKAVRKPGGLALEADNFVAGDYYLVVYDGTDDRYEVIGFIGVGAIINNELQLFGGFSEDADSFDASAGGTKILDVSVATYFHASVAMGAFAYTFQFNNPAVSGRASSFTLELNNAAAASSISWPASVDWANNGAEPTWSSGVDLVTFITRDNGTTWLGIPAGLNFA